MQLTRDDIMGISHGFWTARTVLTAVELGVFDAIGGRKLGAAALARRLRTEPRATEMLLNALAGMGVLTKSGKSFSLPTGLRPVLTEGPGSALGMLRHHAHLWETWSGLTESVRTGTNQPSRSSFRRGPDEARAFTMAMRAGALRLAPGVADEVNLRGRKRLLDLGGGPGIYAAAFARKNPKLHVVVVELPHVAAVGEELIAEHPDVRDRLSYHAADIESDPLPTGADATFLSHVIHGNDEETNLDLYRRIADALEPGGLLVVRDFFLGPDGTTPPSCSLFSLNMLVNTPGGRSYTAQETTTGLRKAGFRTVTSRRSKTAPDAGYLLARK